MSRGKGCEGYVGWTCPGAKGVRGMWGVDCGVTVVV